VLGVRPETLLWKTFLAAKSQTGIAGWISQRQPVLRPRKMKTDLNVATWNVRSLLQVGKLHEIADELIKYNRQMTALQEVRWAESGWIRKKN
jgi:hypothetical protein